MSEELREIIRHDIAQIRKDTHDVVSALAEQVTDLRVEFRGVTTRMADIERVENELRDERKKREDLEGRFREVESWMNQQKGAQGNQSRYQGIWDSVWVRIIGALVAAAVVAAVTVGINNWLASERTEALERQVLELLQEKDGPTGG